MFNRMQKRFLMKLNTFQKKEILLKLIEELEYYKDKEEERAQLILKINSFSPKETDECLQNIIDTYGG